MLNVNDGTEPNSYDPTQQTYTYEAGVGREVFETLLKPNAQGSDVQRAGAPAVRIDVPDVSLLDCHVATSHPHRPRRL